MLDDKTIHCDRCHKQKPGWVVPGPFGCSCGCYDVTTEPWSRFACPHERLVCDDCMWADPGYIQTYGRRN